MRVEFAQPTRAKLAEWPENPVVDFDNVLREKVRHLGPEHENVAWIAGEHHVVCHKHPKRKAWQIEVMPDDLNRLQSIWVGKAVDRKVITP
jgi:hypothetical protein